MAHGVIFLFFFISNKTQKLFLSLLLLLLLGEHLVRIDTKVKKKKRKK